MKFQTYKSSQKTAWNEYYRPIFNAPHKEALNAVVPLVTADAVNRSKGLEPNGNVESLLMQLGLEKAWQKHKHTTLFPAYSSMWSDLLLSKFKADDNAIISLPAPVFSVAMPEGFSVNGVAVPSFLIARNDVVQPYIKRAIMQSDELTIKKLKQNSLKQSFDELKSENAEMLKNFMRGQLSYPPEKISAVLNNKASFVKTMAQLLRVSTSDPSVSNYLTLDDNSLVISMAGHNPTAIKNWASPILIDSSQLSRVLNVDLSSTSEGIISHEIEIYKLGNYAETVGSQRATVLGFVLRIVAAISVYCSAASGNRGKLREGLPPDTDYSLTAESAKSLKQTRATKICIGDRIEDTKSKFKSDTAPTPNLITGQRSPTEVRGHFRNLQADCFYRGEHADTPRGSRWSWVPRHTRGMRAYTVEPESADAVAIAD